MSTIKLNCTCYNIYTFPILFMKLFIDSANIDHVREIAEWGILDGVTTNPTFIAKEKKQLKDVVLEMCKILPNVSAQITALELPEMLKAADEYSSWHEQIIVKVPMTINGLKVVQHCAKKGIRTNVTMITSVNQAILAAKSGATIISPFIGRFADAGLDGIQFIEELMDVWMNYNFPTEVLVASFRNARQITECAKIGVDICTIKYEFLKQMPFTAMTDSGLQKFNEDFKNSQI